MSIQVLHSANEEHFDEVRKLVREFVRWHRDRHHQDIALIDEYFDAKAFEEELATLPGKYAAPKGRLLLAYYNETPAGCVALREIDEQSCEMKRMFVYSQYHGKGVGRALAASIINEAKSIGYSVMKLDTSIRQVEAIGLYQAMGFKHIDPYYEVPKRMADWLVFMELAL